MIPATQEAEAAQEEGKERDKEKKGWRGERRIHSAARTGSSQAPQECVCQDPAPQRRTKFTQCTWKFFLQLSMFANCTVLQLHCLDL